VSKNWTWHHSTLPIHQPRPCKVCGKVIRRMGKHLNQKHPI
jgi:hypothetical protein